MPINGEQLCRACKHSFRIHYTAYGGLMGCGQGMKKVSQVAGLAGLTEVTLRCNCEGFAEIIPRDEYGDLL